VHFVRIEWLGVFPTLESLGLQVLLLIAALVAAAWIFLLRPRTAETSSAGKTVSAERSA
jgi:hypothetical protein